MSAKAKKTKTIRAGDPRDRANLNEILDHEAIIALAKLIQTLYCIGSAPQITNRIADWCRAEPNPGDLVVEMSSRVVHADRVGLFERYESKIVCGHEENDCNHPGCIDPDCLADKADASIRPERFVWIKIQDKPYRHVRWHNCSFIRLPKDAKQLNEAEGRDVPASIDRPALVGLLEDAGFKLKDGQ